MLPFWNFFKYLENLMSRMERGDNTTCKGRLLPRVRARCADGGEQCDVIQMRKWVDPPALTQWSAWFFKAIKLISKCLFWKIALKWSLTSMCQLNCDMAWTCSCAVLFFSKGEFEEYVDY